MKKIRAIFLALIFVIVAVILYFFLIGSSVEEHQQAQYSLDATYYTKNKSSDIYPSPNPNKNAYFGDLHIHTSNSFDAYTFGTLSTPEIAYKYAQGESIPHPTGYDIQLRRPLDFYAVTDHGFFLGLLPSAADTSSIYSKYEYTKPLHNLNESVSNGLLELTKRASLFREFARNTIAGLQDGSIDRDIVDNIQESVWKETVKAADNAYKPGVFTTFAGYEYTSAEDL